MILRKKEENCYISFSIYSYPIYTKKSTTERHWKVSACGSYFQYNGRWCE